MLDQVLLSANDRNIEDCIRVAQEYQLGVELMAFAFPAVAIPAYWVRNEDAPPFCSSATSCV